MTKETMPLRGIIFDMDGTLTKPQNYMFKQMRDALGIDKSKDILLSIEELPESDQDAAHEKIRKIEREAMSSMEQQDGLSTLMKFLDTSGLERGICTRNFYEPTQHLLRTFLKDHPMSPVLTREFTPAKPSPRPLEHICQAWEIKTAECLMVGDGADDLISANKAGMDSILLRNKDNRGLVEKHKPTHIVDDLTEVIQIIRSRMPKS